MATWRSFFTTNMRSARYRPWMPAAGNHENEVGNGPQGYPCYETRFALPDNGSARFTGNWYAFTVGAIRVLSINNDDVCLQDGGFSNIRRDHAPGYRARGPAQAADQHHPIPPPDLGRLVLRLDSCAAVWHVPGLRVQPPGTLVGLEDV